MVSIACWTFQRLWRGKQVSEVGCHFFLVVLDLLVDGCVFSKTAEFALDRDAAWIEGSGLDGVEGRAALGVGVVMVVVEVARAVVEPAAGRIYESCWIQRVHEVGEGEFGVFAFGDLAPAFVVDDPGDDAGVAAVLEDE